MAATVAQHDFARTTKLNPSATDHKFAPDPQATCSTVCERGCCWHLFLTQQALLMHCCTFNLTYRGAMIQSLHPAQKWVMRLTHTQELHTLTVTVMSAVLVTLDCQQSRGCSANHRHYGCFSQGHHALWYSHMHYTALF
jgi:hypothetical protein